MHLTLMLTLAGLAPAVALPEPDNDAATVVLRLRCPSAADAALCKWLFIYEKVLANALRRRWVSDLAIVKQQKDPARWLGRHLRVKASGGEIIRVWVTGAMPRRDRAALANAVLSAWDAELTPSGVGKELQLGDTAAERWAYEEMYNRLRAIHLRNEQALAAFQAARSTAGEEKAREVSEAAERDEAAATSAGLSIKRRFEDAFNRRPYIITRLADGPCDKTLRECARAGAPGRHTAATQAPAR
jgi:hypothetical protein